MADTEPSGAGPRDEAELLRELRTGGASVVALSGGVDSAAVAALAYRALGARAQAVTLAGPAVASEEVERARHVASTIGIAHEVVTVDPVADPRYRSNPSNRCYFCRSVETRAIREWGRPRGFVRYLDGFHLDDLGDDRPGIRAMDEAGFGHPLVWARWRKPDVRAFARTAGLPNWDAPSDACLASRIRHGQEVTVPLLGRIEVAERALRAHGFRRVRVRVDEDRARVEVDAAEVPRLLAEPLGSVVRAELRQLGFTDVELDPAGYPSRANA
jgi:pyridinium-3,5-biscarboxylic acid mononucleotide sulfurtransferase